MRAKRIASVLLTLSLLASTAFGTLANVQAAEEVKAPEPWGALPSAEQLQYQEDELAAFIHFSINTFTGREWGTGQEDPNLFNPTNLDCMQWVKTFKDAGFKRLIMIGKHHDGFGTWLSALSGHNVGSSTDWQNSWQALNGKTGDVLEEVSKACTYYDMDMGLYLSPWDENTSTYGYGTGTDDATDSNGDYNEYYENQLKEMLGNPKYGNNGKFVEVWMDGAKGPGTAKQQYTFVDWFNLIEELQPGCLVYSPYGSTVRWVGNESGIAGDACWSQISKERLRNNYDQNDGHDDMAYLNVGDPTGDIWTVAECDVSLTDGWYWSNGKQPKDMASLTNIYFSSVGRGQPLLLNVPPDNRGQFPQSYVDRVSELGEAVRQTFIHDFAKDAGVTATASSVRGSSAVYAADRVLDKEDETYWTMDDGQTTGSITVDLGQSRTFDVVSLEEYVKLGQRVSSFKVEVHTDSGWKDFSSGKTVGVKRLVRSFPVKADQIRVTITGSKAVPLLKDIGVFKASSAFSMGESVPDGLDTIDNASFTNASSWNAESNAACLSGTTMYSTTTGASTSFTFTGSKAWIKGTKDPNHGIMEVLIDGKWAEDVDTYSPSRSASALLYTTPDLPYDSHTVTLKVKGEKNPASRGTAVGLDYACYLDNGGAGAFTFSPTTYTAEEGDKAVLTIQRIGGTKGEATVQFGTSPGSAVHGRHFYDTSKSVTFADGQATATVEVGTVDNEEITGDLNFFCALSSPSAPAVLGFETSAEVVIHDNDVKVDVDAILKVAAEKNEGRFTGASWATFAEAYDSLLLIKENPSATQEQLALAAKKLQEAMDALSARTLYSAEDPFAFPGKNGQEKLLEAEHFILVPKTGDDYVRVSEESLASGGKKIGWFENGNQIKLPYTAEKAGVYTLKMTYQSGRTDDNQNKLNWSGTNVTAGSISVPGSGTQRPIPFLTVSVDVEITQVGAGELVLTADAQCTPDIDKFEVTAKTLSVTSYTIQATAGEHGSITPSGAISVDEGESQKFVFTPDRGYEVAGVMVNGSSVGTPASYTLSNVRADGSIAVTFRAMDHFAQNNPLPLSDAVTDVEAEALELGGTGGEFEARSTASGGKMAGWLGLTERGNAWLNLWVNVPKEGDYDIDMRYFCGGVADVMRYKNTDGSVDGSFVCEKTVPNFANKTVRVHLKAGDDCIKFYNDEASTANIDKFTITRVDVVAADKSTLKTVLDLADVHVKNGDVDKLIPAAKEKFNAVLKNAQDVYADEAATEAQVDKAWKDLMLAIQGLGFVPGDKTALAALFAAADVLDLDLYEDGAEKTAFTAALTKAEEVLSDANALPSDVNEAHDKLDAAIKALKPRPTEGDKTELGKVIATAESYDLTKYVSDANKTNFEKVLAEAKAFYDSDDKATQGEIDQMRLALITAMNKLRLRADKATLNDWLEKLKALDLTKYSAEDAAAVRVMIAQGEAMAAQDLGIDEAKLIEAMTARMEALYTSIQPSEPDPGESSKPDSKPEEGSSSETPDEPENSSSTTGGSSSTSDGAKTGDSTPIAAVSLLAVAAAGAVLLFKKRRNG